VIAKVQKHLEHSQERVQKLQEQIQFKAQRRAKRSHVSTLSQDSGNGEMVSSENAV